MTRTTARLVRLAGGLMAGAVVLAGCSGGSSDTSADSGADRSADATSSASATTHNEADVAFVQGMLPHHEGALRMAQLADGRAADPRVIDLADRIEAAQGPEIETMTGPIWVDSPSSPTPKSPSCVARRSCPSAGSIATPWMWLDGSMPTVAPAASGSDCADEEVQPATSSAEAAATEIAPAIPRTGAIARRRDA